MQEFYESLENNFSDSESDSLYLDLSRGSEEVTKIKKYIMGDFDSDSSDELGERGKKKREPVYIVIFDDLSSELKYKAVPYFMKQNRHFKALCILSSQYLFDLAKDGRN